MIGAVELGGTNINCACFDNGRITRTGWFPFDTPEKTVSNIAGFFGKGQISALGVACFGPICLDRGSDRYGALFATVKPGWSEFNIRAALEEALGVPVSIDTDVNTACLGETVYGSCKGLDTVAYITVGTGIGMGAVIGGRPYHGAMHPEGGHLFVPRAEGDDFEGVCPFHGDCVEGLACGPAVQARKKAKGTEIGEDDPIWHYESTYLAQLCYIVSCTLSPQAIVIGGGVMENDFLYEMIRKEFGILNNRFLRYGEVTDPGTFIRKPALGGKQALYGCVELTRL